MNNGKGAQTPQIMISPSLMWRATDARVNEDIGNIEYLSRGRPPPRTSRVEAHGPGWVIPSQSFI